MGIGRLGWRLLAALGTGWPLIVGGRGSTLHGFRDWAARVPPDRAAILRLPWLAARFLLWPLRAGLMDRRFAVWWRCVAYNFTPFEIRHLGLDQPGRDPAGYLSSLDLRGLRRLNGLNGADATAVNDKRRFAAICTAARLPHIPILADFSDPAAVLPPDVDVVFAKARRGRGAAAATIWRRQSAGWGDSAGLVCDENALRRVLAAAGCLLQPVIANHPGLAAVAGSALACLRVVTVRPRHGAAQPVYATLWLPRAGRVVSQGGIACEIDCADGRVIARETAEGMAVDRHPDSGAVIGQPVAEHWPAALALVLAAHDRAFARFVSLGWDVALTPAGPLLIEANEGWAALFHQRLAGPIDRTSFVAGVASHLPGGGR